MFIKILIYMYVYQNFDAYMFIKISILMYVYVNFDIDVCICKF